MIEFGSDFHFVVPDGMDMKSISCFLPSGQYYADGRQSLLALFASQGWKRLWVPEYFCNEVLLSLTSWGINLAFYLDYPGADDEMAVGQIPFENGDALLRVNYYGIRGFRSNQDISVPVVEDHTHDLIGHWALNSDADWCFASLRKTLPIAEGGLLWSPSKRTLPPAPSQCEENEKIASLRWDAMRLKKRYLSGEEIEKKTFRDIFVETESFFETASVSALDEQTSNFLGQFNIHSWYTNRCRNWQALNSIKTDKFRVLYPENDGCHPFSFTILCASKDYRDYLRKRLVESQIYPAILWRVPETTSSVSDFSSKMLSIHCDARYSSEDILQMKGIIEAIV